MKLKHFGRFFPMALADILCMQVKGVIEMALSQSSVVVAR